MKKRKLRWDRIIIVIVAFICIVVGLALIIAFSKGALSCSGKGGNSSSQSSRTAAEGVTVSDNGEYIKIRSKDVTLYIGDSVSFGCYSNPAGYAELVSWNVSDPGVLVVSDTGLVSVIGSGVSALTAVYGTLSDSIIIQALDPSDSEDRIDYETVLIVDGTISYDETEQSGELPSGSSGELPSGSSGEPSSGSSGEPSSGSSSAEPTQPAENNTDNGNSENTTTDQSNQGEPATTANSSSQSGVRDKAQIKADAVLTAETLGFTHYNGDVYTFYEDNNYLGQLVLTSERAEIYVKLRTSSFDKAVIGLIDSIVPARGSDIYNVFIASLKDSTSYYSGHRVSIMVNEGSGHSQLSVFY